MPVQNLRFAFRTLYRSRGVSAVAILTLALGIGAATTIFSVTDALLFHVFPYRDSGRLVLFRFHELRPAGYDGVASPPAAAVQDFRAANSSFEDIIGFWNARLPYITAGGAQQVDAAWVTPNAFAFLGVPAELGRGLLATDTAACVVSHAFWQQQLHADPKAIGTALDLNGVPRVLVGVMPPRFQFLGVSAWIPLGNAAGQPRYLEMMARLKRGVSLRAATAEYDAFERRLAQTYPKEYPDNRFTVSLRTLTDDAVGNLKPVLFTLFGAVLMLLLIACSNVANLLLVRATVRRPEMAIRAAVGASRGRIVAQLMMESAVLATVAALCGCLLASFGLRALAGLIPSRLIPAGAEIAIHPPALWFALGITIATTLLCGLAPALQAAGANLGVPMARTTHRGRGLRNALVVAEVALSIVLLAGAGLMTRTFLALTRVDLGFNPAHLLSVELRLPRGRYQGAAAEQAFLNDVVARLRRLPGVTAAGVSFEVPPVERGPLVELDVVGRPARQAVPAMLAAAGEEAFQTMGRTIRRGRDFSAADIIAARQVLVVNETFARTFFGGAGPTGEKVHFHLERMIGAPLDPTFEIAGVVTDVRNQGVRQPVAPEAYLPYTLPLVGLGSGGILVRSAVPPISLVESIRRQVWALDSNVVLTNPTTLVQAVAESSYNEPRFGLVSLGGFAAIGLALVVVGVFSVMAYTVSVQTREIGIRVALGARQSQILAGVLRNGVALLAAGIVIGIPASLSLTRLLASQLWGVTPSDPRTFVAVTVLLVVAGSAACWIPARQAARVDPLTALRHE